MPSVVRNRKWELVSAFQKAIRRGDWETTSSVISAMEASPEEYRYFWKRLCVIACEDVGPADDVLVKFTLACCSTFCRKSTGDKNFGPIYFLAEQMCALPTRSRIYCSSSLVVEFAHEFSNLSPAETRIVAQLRANCEDARAGSDGWKDWQRKNRWRSDGLLKFVDSSLALEQTVSALTPPPSTMLAGLPSYAYDMYTRVGTTVLRRVMEGGEGLEGITSFFRRTRVKDAYTALGEALFFAEGGRIRNELIYRSLADLEQRMFAQKFGLEPETWQVLQGLVEETVHNGVLNLLRKEVLREYYGCI